MLVAMVPLQTKLKILLTCQCPSSSIKPRLSLFVKTVQNADPFFVSFLSQRLLVGVLRIFSDRISATSCFGFHGNSFLATITVLFNEQS